MHWLLAAAAVGSAIAVILIRIRLGRPQRAMQPLLRASAAARLETSLARRRLIDEVADSSKSKGDPSE